MRPLNCKLLVYYILSQFSFFTLTGQPVVSQNVFGLLYLRPSAPLYHSMVSLDQCQAPGACLVVTVLDHDTLMTDDFEGEAFLGLKAIPGVGGGREGDELSSKPDSTPAQIRLPLMHPKPNGKIFQWL